MKISITIANKIAKADNPPTIVCGNSDYTIAFNFDSEWNEYALKTARFAYVVCGRLKRYIDVVFSGNECSVPKLHNIDAVEVGVYAGDLHTTTPAYIPCEKSILCDGGVPDSPSEDVYNQIMELIAESGAGGGKQEVFLAEFSKTQYADIHAAVESGMVVVVRDVEQGNVAYYALCEQTESGYAFGCIYGETPNFIVTVAIDVADVWSKKYTHLATEEYVDEKVATLELVKIVTELPDEGEENKTYFVTKTDGEGNDIYDEYMWVNDAWEYIGTKQFDIDLTDYVKKTDYARVGAAGVVKMANHNSYGLYMANNGDTIAIAQATEDDVKNKSGMFKPITPTRIDLAVKTGITTNSLTLTDEEKAAACEWLGAVGEADYPDAKNFKAGVIRVDNYYGFNVGQAGSAGVLLPLWASNAEIDSKSDRRFINAKNFDYALAKSLTTNAETLTDAEKEIVQKWLGVTAATNEAKPYSFVKRSANGVIYTGTPTEAQHAANKAYVDGLAVERKQGVVTFENDGTQNNIQWHYNAMGGTIARRMGNGTLWVATPDHDSAAANKAYVDAMGGVFYAEYGVTKYAEIQAAIEAGKAVFVTYFDMGNTNYFTLCRHTVNVNPLGYSFSSVYPLADLGIMKLGYANVNEADEWSEAWKTIALE